MFIIIGRIWKYQRHTNSIKKVTIPTNPIQTWKGHIFQIVSMNDKVIPITLFQVMEPRYFNVSLGIRRI